MQRSFTFHDIQPFLERKTPPTFFLTTMRLAAVPTPTSLLTTARFNDHNLTAMTTTVCVTLKDLLIGMSDTHITRPELWHYIFGSS